jgi:hypothetical protein
VQLSRLILGRLSVLVSIWCPSEASVGQIRGKSVTLNMSVLLNDIRVMNLFPD